MTDLLEHLKKNKALIKINSVDECFDLFSWRENLASPFSYFRGHSNENFKLNSSLDRFKNDEWGGKENLLIREFKKIAKNYIHQDQMPSSTFEWLSLMQHYGIPTRLLDVTTSRFIALYFAVQDWTNTCDCAVWAINPYSMHDCSLHRLRNSSSHQLEIPDKYDNNFHLPDFITDQYFNEVFMSGKHKVCMILEPEKAEKRLFHQQGAFLVTSGRGLTTEEILLDVFFDKSYKTEEEIKFKEKGSLNWGLVKVVIDGKLKKRIFEHLLSMNINASTLFPDIVGAAAYVTESVRVFDLIGNRWNLKRKK